MSNALTLAEIIRRGISPEWPEGVALVRSVTERLASKPTPLVPELHHIELGPTGSVDVLGGSSTSEPVRRLGQLLQATLGQSEPPVQLRLIISQATAPTPSFASIRELDEVLGYYERPNRHAVLQALYERAATASPVPASQPKPTPTVDSIAPLPSRESARRVTPAKTPAQRRRARRQMFAAAVLLLAIAGGVQYIRVSGTAQRNAELTAMAAKASDAVGEAVVAGLSAVTEQAGLGRLVTETAATEPPPAPAAVAGPPTPGSRNSREPARLQSEANPIVVYDLEARPAPVAGPANGDEPTAAPPIAPPSVAESNAEPEVFTPANQEVVPPVGIRPQLPRELPPNVRLEDLARIELVVAVDGTVEAVKLISSPRNVHDSMWLSAVKAWQFQPALKEGRPVRYLKTVWIAAQ